MLVLADFANTTGDPVFDGTLRQGLSVQLEQSPFLSIVSDETIQQTLKLMGQPADAKLITGNCAGTLPDGRAARRCSMVPLPKIGTRYLLTLKAVNCEERKNAGEHGSTGERREPCARCTWKTCPPRYGISWASLLSTIQKFDTPLGQATTPSLEALKAYSLGRKASAGSEWAAAVPFFQRAIRLDPNFSIAYARLGNCYRMLGEPTLAAENTRKAYESARTRE